jgi:hypothetical protein
MFAAVFAAIAAFQQVFFREDEIAFGAVIKILGIQFLFEHGALIIAYKSIT